MIDAYLWDSSGARSTSRLKIVYIIFEVYIRSWVLILFKYTVTFLFKKIYISVLAVK